MCKYQCHIILKSSQNGKSINYNSFSLKFSTSMLYICVGSHSTQQDAEFATSPNMLQIR